MGQLGVAGGDTEDIGDTQGHWGTLRYWGQWESEDSGRVGTLGTFGDINVIVTCRRG